MKMKIGTVTGEPEGGIFLERPVPNLEMSPNKPNSEETMVVWVFIQCMKRAVM